MIKINACAQYRSRTTPEGTHCRQVDDKLEPGRLLDGQVDGFGVLEDAVDIDGGSPEDFDVDGAIAHQPASLAHVIDNKVEADYRRGGLFEKRRKLMEAWAVYCSAPKAGKIVVFRRRA